ncbi:membrane protease subunit HflC [Rhodopseudomonas julia]|uniref:Membrane protease subunit HflC n=1 Tax=Rhodopseudomonas julia TaxID=200617 RepID=A0ABU0C875_9BRAD|nr:SPFH domain-containing protein [Rhodopseudomonas julia]MDQ0326695.1 membrane protease subunit HflC [Rhodopseudomonas julia]
MRRLWIILLAVVVLLILLYSSVFVVNERQQALVLRFGEINRVIEEPGIYFKVPTNFVETVQIIEDRLLSFDLEDIRVQVRDGRRYLVDAFLAFKIVDPRKFRENVSGSLEIAQQNLRTRLDASLRRVYGQRSFEAALSEERVAMMVEVRDQLRPLAVDLGIEIVDVRIKRTDLLPEVSQQTFDRMKAERLAEAAELRARGTEQAARIRAEADREAQVTVAEASRDADILRGEGDAQRNIIFARAYGQDENFFEFYRTMKAYQTGIQGTGTTMLLKPDSQFFRYFQQAVPEGTLPAPQPAIDLPDILDLNGEGGPDAADSDESRAPAMEDDGAAIEGEGDTAASPSDAIEVTPSPRAGDQSEAGDTSPEPSGSADDAGEPGVPTGEPTSTAIPQ